MGLQGKGRARKILRQTAGYICIAVGAAGCVLPVLPGIPLLFAGLGLLAADSPWAARLRDRIRETAERQMAKLRKKTAPES